MKFFFITALLSLSFSGFTRELSKEQKLDDLRHLVSMIKSGYGPLEYKKLNYKIDIDQLEEKFSALISKSTSNSEFYYLIVQFVASFNDSHFGARIPTNHKGSLGFTTDFVDNKVLIENINTQLLPKRLFPFEKGDEIISINGVSTEEIMNNLMPYMGQGSELTAKRKAGTLVSRRFGSFTPVKNGNALVKIKKGSSSFIEEVKLKWILSGTPLDEYIPTLAPPTKGFSYSSMNKVPFGEISLVQDQTFENSFRCSGGTRTKIPKDATIIMLRPFVAYYHKTKKGNVGYLRIPHYSPTEPNPSINPLDLRFSQYEFAVSELEKNTEALIIDQDHNCGGSVAYLHRIVSLFADKPFAPMQFKLLANKESYLGFRGWMNETYKYTMGYQSGKDVVDLIKNTWQNKDSFLTEKTSLSGKKLMPVHTTHYTKPIIVLIDENSGSGGDAFPALLQGTGRAKLLGTRTMGAGGHVAKLPALGHSQIAIRMTKSLFYHPNNVAIENNGASPDIKYRPTREDFMYQYQGYQKFYLTELLKLIK